MISTFPAKEALKVEDKTKRAWKSAKAYFATKLLLSLQMQSKCHVFVLVQESNSWIGDEIEDQTTFTATY